MNHGSFKVQIFEENFILVKTSAIHFKTKNHIHNYLRFNLNFYAMTY